LPSLSSVGSDVLAPRYLSSNVSKLAAAAEAEPDAAEALDAALVAEVAALVAEVEAFDA
jgi:hypothetical protein